MVRPDAPYLPDHPRFAPHLPHLMEHPMRYSLRALIVAGLCCGISILAPISSATAADRYEVEVKDNIKYGKGADQELMLTLARPKVEKDEARPCLVFIHGGGWQGGNRQS